MTPAESELQLTSRGITGVPPDALSKVRTNAAVDATPAGQQRSLPLVVLSPGFTNSRSALTALAEDLASHGYVVAGIDHTYESHATAFPDGRVTTSLAREARRRGSDRPVPGGDGRPLRRRGGCHRGDGGRLPHPRGHRHGRRHVRRDPG
jgi:predicted dienelactone hydrolase